MLFDFAVNTLYLFMFSTFFSLPDSFFSSFSSWSFRSLDFLGFVYFSKDGDFSVNWSNFSKLMIFSSPRSFFLFLGDILTLEKLLESINDLIYSLPIFAECTVLFLCTRKGRPTTAILRSFLSAFYLQIDEGDFLNFWVKVKKS